MFVFIVLVLAYGYWIYHCACRTVLPGERYAYHRNTSSGPKTRITSPTARVKEITEDLQEMTKEFAPRGDEDEKAATLKPNKRVCVQMSYEGYQKLEELSGGRAAKLLSDALVLYVTVIDNGHVVILEKNNESAVLNLKNWKNTS
jgi:hypothetical protein